MSRYNTNQRNTILEFLIENKDKHITVEDIQFHLKNSGKNVGKSTIYRYFELLMNDGMLRKYTTLDNKSACYQYIDKFNKCNEHYHFVCDKCNELFHIDCSLLNAINGHILENHQFKINNLKTIFHGVCKNCS